MALNLTFIHMTTGPERVIKEQSALPRAQLPYNSLLMHSGFYVALFVLAVAVLVAIFRVPPILDYPNHLARIFLLAGGLDQPFLSSAYAVDWSQARTNIGIDLLAYWLGPLIGPEVLARSLLFLAIVLPPLGAIMLNRALFGKDHPFQIAILFLAWSTTLIGGFINFQIGLGLAFLFALLDLRVGQRRLLFISLWRAVACFVLTLDHVFAAGFYLVLSAGLELPRHFRDFANRRKLGAAASRIVLAGVVGLAPIVALVFSAKGLPGDGQAVNLTWNTPLLALSNFLSAITSYSTPLDVALFVPIALIIVEARSRHKIAVHFGLLISVSFLFVLSLLAPRHAMGTGWISWRFPIMTLLAGAAAVRPFPDAHGSMRRWLIGATASAVFARTLAVAVFWWQGEQDVTAVQRAIAALPPNSSVLPVAHQHPNPTAWLHASRSFFWGQDTIRHLPTLATSQRGAFVPTLFTATGKQPLVVTDKFRDISVPEGNLVSTGALLCESVRNAYLPFAPYLADWRDRFDYVLVVNADYPDRYVGSVMPDGLTRISDAGFAALYAVDKTTPAPPPVEKPLCPSPDALDDK
ncbi:hypothetical protein [Pleomorphomonas sp. NRK KF1]|uniref:hypothetical protein n=1 Tax=Pleomorphomonas sp. NRK KF1 TaxID=2943000 RepID=UPI0020442E6B|nr:hypothetical protein [Pleomorphomonas sp. NRK KF1]MCM5553604.1 hypothetical protein [Pleomorphomonas sp. NRK KF1]